jgi:hypothetical protein
MTSPRGTARLHARPAPITQAVALLVLVALIDFLGPILPGSEGEVLFGAVSGGLTLIAAAGLWAMRRWGYLMTIVIAGLTVLLAVLPLFAEISAALKLVAALQGLWSAVALLLATKPAARSAYR